VLKGCLSVRTCGAHTLLATHGAATASRWLHTQHLFRHAHGCSFVVRLACNSGAVVRRCGAAADGLLSLALCAQGCLLVLFFSAVMTTRRARGHGMLGPVCAQGAVGAGLLGGRGHAGGLFLSSGVSTGSGAMGGCCMPVSAAMCGAMAAGWCPDSCSASGDSPSPGLCAQSCQFAISSVHQ
jgi:hypothetical protein